MEECAYLRHLPQTNQCELVVVLNVVFQDIAINEEIHSVRKVTDNIGSLIDHTKNKLTKIINDKKGVLKQEEEQRKYDIPITCKRKIKRRLKCLPNDMCLLKFLSLTEENTILRIFNQDFKLLINPPLIKSLYLPSILYATYNIQPYRFYGLHTDKNKSEFIWYKSKDKIIWEKVGNNFEYLMSIDDIGYFLKVVCIPVSFNLIKGPPAEAISSKAVQEFPPLPACPFEARHEYTTKLLQNQEFRVVTYNTLSNRYTELNDTFSYCPPEVLAIHYRKQLIFKELTGYNADIICLQEIDNYEFNSYFKELLAEQGYISKFHRKGNNLPEGLLCAVKKSRYKLLSYQQIIFANALRTRKLFEALYQSLKKNEDFKSLFLKQPTSLQTIVLKCKETKRIILIGNTHLYYHPDAMVVRLIQAYMALKYLVHTKEKLSEESKSFEVVMILCGDLNSSPDSLVYQFLFNGKIPSDNEFLLQVLGHNQMEFTHELNLISACGTPKYTNYTRDFKNCLDYIFIEGDKIKVKNSIPLPEEQLEQYEGLPNEVYPSDHVALVVDLEFECEMNNK